MRPLFLALALTLPPAVVQAATLTTLASFNGANGSIPLAGLIADKAGNLFGTTYQGGATNQGTIFELPKGGALTDLASFGGANGALPQGGLIAYAGNLFGTASSGGANGKGTVFELPKGGALTVLASFNGANGSIPLAGLIADSAAISSARPMKAARTAKARCSNSRRAEP